MLYVLMNEAKRKGVTEAVDGIKKTQKTKKTNSETIPPGSFYFVSATFTRKTDMLIYLIVTQNKNKGSSVPET